MFCPKCGASVNNGTAFCARCGAELPAPKNYQPPHQPPQYRQPQNQPPQLLWFKFLIYFSLFAGAVLNFRNGILYITGDIYGGSLGVTRYYSYFGGWKPLDMLYGVAQIALAAFGVYTRFRLAGFYKNGPKLLNATYIASAAISFLRPLGAVLVLGERMSVSFVGTGILVFAVMVAVNTVYFKKRAYMFVN